MKVTVKPVRFVNLSTLPAIGRAARPVTCYCERADCGASTREGKSHCSEHVDELPYVRDLMVQLAKREADDDVVKRRGAAGIDLGSSITAQEIMLHLSLHGTRTMERLCRELNLEDRTLRRYLAELRRRKLVRFGTTKRGSTTVAATGPSTEIEEPTKAEWEQYKPRKRASA